MPNFCTCSSSPLNTGVPNTQRPIGIAYRLAFVYLKANDGTLNAITSTDTLNQAFFTAKVNEDDVSKRWYPIGPFVNVEDTREDATFEEYNDGTRAAVRQGRRTFTGMILDHFGKYLGVVDSFSCQSIGAYIIDDCGAMYGEISSDGLSLYPIPVNASSMDNMLVKKTNTERGKVRVQFDYSQIHLDSDLRVISTGELGGADLLRLEGLRDVTVTTANPTTTGFDATLSLSYDGGPTTSSIPVTGWVGADFSLYNTTTAAAVVIDSATESPDGTYAIAYSSGVSASDVLRLRSAKDGFWFETTVTIP